MYKWILRCLAFRRIIFIFAVVVIIISALGLRHLKFDYKMSVTQQTQPE